jgi:beta-galactosidase
MIVRDRNHPSIVLWGVRINESWDDEAFYKATNALAHELDPTRQRRVICASQFLEDVFTYNDFSNTVRAEPHTPHGYRIQWAYVPHKIVRQEER